MHKNVKEHHIGSSDVIFGTLIRRSKITMTSMCVAIIWRRLECLGPYFAITTGNAQQVEKLYLWPAKTIYQWHIHRSLANKLQGIIIPTSFSCNIRKTHWSPVKMADILQMMFLNELHFHSVVPEHPELTFGVDISKILKLRHFIYVYMPIWQYIYGNCAMKLPVSTHRLIHSYHCKLYDIRLHFFYTNKCFVSTLPKWDVDSCPFYDTISYIWWFVVKDLL